MYIEGLAQHGSTTFCNQWVNGQCNGCGHCDTKPQALQERYFFLFDTMCGHSALRCRFDGAQSKGQLLIDGDMGNDYTGSDNNVDFLFGFVGYSYRSVTDKSVLRSEIAASIDADKPVIVKLVNCPVRFSVITGCDGDSFTCPSFRSAQRCVEHPPVLDEIEAAYIIDGKCEPKYHLIDALRRIEGIMQSNLDEGLWDGYMEHIGKYGPNGLDSVDVAGKKARMARVAQTMWYTFNCHNFAEVFRYFRDGRAGIYDCVNDVSRLNNPACMDAYSKIGGPLYGYTHDLAWALIGLEGCANWNAHPSGYYGEMVELVIAKLKENDEGVLACIREIIATLYV